VSAPPPDALEPGALEPGGLEPDDGAPQDNVRRGALLMFSGTAVSRLLGLLRGMVLAAAIGATGQVADAFSVANKLPNILYQLLIGGTLNAVLVPQVVRAYRRRAGQEYVDRLLTLGFAVLGGSTVLLTLASPLLVRLYATPGSAAQLELATVFAYWSVPQMFFYGAYALIGQVLNARGSFGPYMWAPVANNIVAIAGFGVFLVIFGPAAGAAEGWDVGRVALVAGGSTLGIVAQAVVLVPFLRRAGVHYRVRWGFRGVGLGRAGQVTAWTLVRLVILQIGFVIVSRVASAAPAAAALAEGRSPDEMTGVAGNAAYDYAYLVFMLPHSLITLSLITALFTRLSGQASEGDLDGVRGSLSVGLRTTGVFTVGGAALLAVLAEPVVRIIVPTAAAADVRAVAAVVIAMVIGLPAFGAWSMCQRVYYAYEDARGMIVPQIVMTGVVIGGTLLGMAVAPPRTWVAISGVAASVQYVIGTVMALVTIRRRIGRVDGTRVLTMHVRATLAAVLASAVGVGVLLVFGSGSDVQVLGALVRCVVVGSVMGLSYLGALRLLRVTELDLLLSSVRSVVRRLVRRSGGAG